MKIETTETKLNVQSTNHDSAIGKIEKAVMNSKFNPEKIADLEERLEDVLERVQIAQINIDSRYGNEKPQLRAIEKGAQLVSPKVIPILKACLADKAIPLQVREEALYGLQRQKVTVAKDHETIEAIVQACNDMNEKLRNIALDVLQQIDPLHPVVRKRMEEPEEVCKGKYA
ncbi:MAG: hypothetical protein C4B58_06885 [Deltaproteobacteria bacterium]|nr:MAG: hypothetical protein C4B58_06885 [Deltaproteobacteria bacterium]